MLAWLAPLLVFGLVIFVHELGHFLAAKWFGVYTPRFSVGFGPALWRRRKGETEYIVAALPLGGYVRMASKEDEAQAFLEGGGETKAEMQAEAAEQKPKDWDPEAMIPFGPKPIPPHRWFESKPTWQRLVILVSGVAMNALLAWVVTVGTFAFYGGAYAKPVVQSVVADRPAARAGVLAGDSIVAVEGAPVTEWDDVVELISARPEQPTTIDVVRRGERISLTLTPQADTATDTAGAVRRVGRIGIAPEVGRNRISIAQAVTGGTRATVMMAGAVFTGLKMLFSGQAGIDDLGGPVRIAEISVDAARGGFEVLLGLIALISINLAVLNLLPIPVLDGGNIVILLIEAAKGSPLSERARRYVMYGGLAFILSLALVLTYNDIARLVGRLIGG